MEQTWKLESGTVFPCERFKTFLEQDIKDIHQYTELPTSKLQISEELQSKIAQLGMFFF